MERGDHSKRQKGTFCSATQYTKKKRTKDRTSTEGSALYKQKVKFKRTNGDKGEAFGERPVKMGNAGIPNGLLSTKKHLDAGVTCGEGGYLLLPKRKKTAGGPKWGDSTKNC